MSLRGLVTGTDACTTADAPGPSNPLSRLADALLNSVGKGGTSGQELPRHVRREDGASGSQTGHGLLAPGRGPQGFGPGISEADVSEFLRGHGPGLAGDAAQRAAFEGAFQDASSSRLHLPMAADPHLRLEAHLGTFLRGGPVEQAGPLPHPLNVEQQVRIRDRCTILARHVFSSREADERVSDLLRFFGIDAARLPMRLQKEWEAAWNGGSQMMTEPPAWVDDFQRRLHISAKQPAAQQGLDWAREFGSAAPSAATAAPASWGEEFAADGARDRPAEAWAQDFGEQERARGRDNPPSVAASSAALAQALLSSDDPKMQQSVFASFVSKMSRGELSIEGNRVVEGAVARQGDAWAGEFAETQRSGAEGRWADSWLREFEGAPRAQADLGQAELGVSGADLAAWVEDFHRAATEAGAPGQLQELQRVWAEQFGGGMAHEDPWAEEFMAAGAGGYRFHPDNPFAGDTQALERGRALFAEGLLSEAVLALEAAVQQEPGNAERWRLLGAVNAENDDDGQSIAAMREALRADPANREVLMSLGVSHTNELHERDAIGFLRRWLETHPTYSSTSLPTHADSEPGALSRATAEAFAALAQAHPHDPDLFIATGVLHTLHRDYDSSVEAFRRALDLRPHDYSLWNKLGATQANGGHNEEAIAAYREALRLKPNYLRAWVNMGIAHANLGKYVQAAEVYLRALAMNPGADHVWSYLRNALICGARHHLAPVAEKRDIPALQAALAQEAQRRAQLAGPVAGPAMPTEVAADYVSGFLQQRGELPATQAGESAFVGTA